jgi:hypothetical protein
MLGALLKLNGSKFFTVTFIKKDKSIRTINGRLGVTKHLKGGSSTLDKEKFLIVYSIADKGYRAINKETILNIRMDNLTIYTKEGI